MMSFLKWTVEELQQKTEEIRQQRQQIERDIEFWREANEWLERRSQQEKDAQRGSS